MVTRESDSLSSRLTKQATHGVAIDALGGALEPIEGSEAIVVSRVGIGAVFEQHRDRLEEAGLRRIVQRAGVSAVRALSNLASIIDARAVPKQRADVVRVVLATLIAVQLSPIQLPSDRRRRLRSKS